MLKKLINNNKVILKINKKTIFLLLFFLIASDIVANDWQQLPSGKYRLQRYQDVDYLIFNADIANVSLHWRDNNGHPYRNFNNLYRELRSRGKYVNYLSNASIYSKDHRPAGLWIENSNTINKINLNNGSGNFHIAPNGIFYIKNNQAVIVTTSKYLQQNVNADFALQSGPLLLRDGKINSKFIKDIDSPHKRNCVCLDAQKKLYFITTQNALRFPNFYQFSSAIKEFGCRDALYLDGSISSAYVAGDSSINFKNLFHWSEFVGIIAVTSNTNL